MNENKWIYCIALIVSIMVGVPQVSFAGIVSFEGGLVGDPTMDEGVYEYQEMFFLSGEPILLTGTVEVPDKPKDGDTEYSQDYTFNLQNTEKNITLTRSVTFDVVEVVNESMQQTTLKSDINSLSETIDVGGTTYTLAGYLFDESQLIDNTPAVDYFNGNLYSKRKYYINGTQLTNEGVVTVEITSDSYVGYEHLWGDSETQVLQYDIQAELPAGDDGKSKSWSGQVVLKMSSQTRNKFKYSGTDPQNISFRGNYVKVTSEENVLRYSYNLPTISSGTANESDRNVDEVSMKSDIITDSTSLITSKIRDIGGHWAEDSIYLMTSLEVFSADQTYFGPDLPVERMEFAQAITKSIADIKPYTKAEIIKRDRQRDREDLYIDVNSDDPNLSFVEFVKNKGLMVGEGDYFMPDKTLTRAQAISIMVNALGMSHLAPAPPYTTEFTDDDDIPAWGKDAIYVANDIGLIDGYEDGTIRPNKIVTRAEAAVMLETFIRHIKDKITYDYREKVISRY